MTERVVRTVEDAGPYVVDELKWQHENPMNPDFFERGDLGLEQNIVRVAVSSAVFAIDKPYDYLVPDSLAKKIEVGMRVMVPFGRGNKKCEAMVLSLECKESDKELKSVLSVLDESPVITPELLKLALWVRERTFSSLYDVFRAMLPTGLWYKFEKKYALASGCDEQSVLNALGDRKNADMIASYIAKTSEIGEREFIEAFEDENLLSQLARAGVLRVYDTARRKVSDKTVRHARLAVSAEQAREYATKCKRRAPMQYEVLNLLANCGGASCAELCYFTGASAATINTLVGHGLLEIEEQETFRRPKLKAGAKRQEITLNDEQERVYRELSGESDCASASLLFGVTGSGKTLIYMKLIEDVIARGRGAIMLVPEIALTPQMVERFYAYFGDRIAILHSALAVGERFDEWKRISRGEVSVVVGTRSAVFAPIPNLGLIILDEEQEHTYKSASAPRYHARDVAKFRCVQSGAKLLLGSATPSVESMYAAKSGRYTLHEIKNRFNEAPLPQVLISDLREELRRGNGGSISSLLASEIQKNLDAGEQSILFLNRRGRARAAICMECGAMPECPNCSVSLTYHSANGRLMCHHCGHSRSVPKACPKCGGELNFIGAGTQKIEDELSRLFPGVPILRMDHDTTGARASHESLLSKFEKERIPILVGTQMITKGLDFENVTLVGVLDADQALYVDDFRAQESTFSLITQVVGRAGRGSKTGRAVIQTHFPKNEIIARAAAQDYEGFYNDEIALREVRSLPPFRDAICFLISGASEYDTFAGAKKLVARAEFGISSVYSDLNAKILGPAPAYIARIHGKYRYKVTMICENSRRARNFVSQLLFEFKTDTMNRKLGIIADVNPIDF